MHLIAENMSARRTPSVRRGITLPEMIVVMVLLGLVVGGLMTVLVRQQRFYTGTSEIIIRRGVRGRRSTSCRASCAASPPARVVERLTVSTSMR